MADKSNHNLKALRLTDYGWLQINEDGTWDVLSSSGLTEERVERVITTSDRLVTGHLTIRLDTMLQTVQLPAGISHLHSGLADMYGDTLTLEKKIYRLTNCRTVRVLS